jgi:SAM-dependent methyltransferase
MLEDHFHRPVLGMEVDARYISDGRNTCIGDVARMPLRDSSMDLVVCNHLYEHVGNQPACLRELRRILGRRGTVYFTLCNKYRVIEPHYRLPFLSWLPAPAADAYLRLAGRGASYRDINFPNFNQLARSLAEAGLSFRDITWNVILCFNDGRGGWIQRSAIRVLRAVPARLRDALLRQWSPQWFLMLQRQGSSPEVPGRGVSAGQSPAGRSR